MNDININRRSLFFLGITSFFIAILYFVANLYNFVPIEYNFSVGEIAERDIIAPFDFPIYKSEEQLKAERENAASKAKPIYKISQNLKFNALKNLDFIFDHFTNLGRKKSISQIKEELRKSGYNLSDETIKYLMNTKNRIDVYNYLTQKITKIMDVGIYPSSLSANKIKLYKNNKISVYALSRLYSLKEAKQSLVSTIGNNKKRKVIEDLANIILIENIVIDNNLTRIEKQKLQDSIPITSGKVQKNEKIISKNQKITPMDLAKLNSLIKEQKERYGEQKKSKIILSSLGMAIFSFILLYIYFHLVYALFGIKLQSFADVLVTNLSIFVSLFIYVILNVFVGLHLLLLPYFFTVIIISQIYNYKMALVYNLLQFIFLSSFLRWNISILIILFIIMFFGIYAGKFYQKRKNDFIIFLFLIFGSIIINTIMSVIKLNTFFVFLKYIYFTLISVSISYIIYILLMPVVERKMNRATKRVLLELINVENDLMKELSTKAPGTYHHSIKVGNIAETAAESIGADYLLTRAGGYLHDIGKLYHPEYFSENNSNSSEIHDKLLPNESAILIKNHVSEGIKLAKKYNLPSAIIDIIAQHHGDGLTKYFYRRAKSMGLIIDINDFKYPGPKPQTKEAAIVMIADCVESTINSKQNSETLNKDTIRKIIDDQVKSMIDEGQLDESPLTISDIKKIKESVLPIILGIYSQRIEYPEEEEDER